MSSKTDKLEVLFKTFSAAEKMALQERQRIDEICSKRLSVLNSLTDEEEKLESELEEIENNGRKRAFRLGSASDVGSLSAYSERLRKELKALKVKVESAREDYERAKERVELAESELVQARIEKKKVERLIDSQKLKKRIKDEAQSEAASDDIRNFKSKND